MAQGPLSIRIVAPSGVVPSDRFDRGRARLTAMVAPRSVEFDLASNLHSRGRYLAGSDDVRAEPLAQAWRQPGAHAIWCARGGYGAARLLRQLNALDIQTQAPIVGFSDSTALLTFAAARGWPAIHGPVITQLGEVDAISLQCLRDWLAGHPDHNQSAPHWAGLVDATVLNHGEASGPLLGGNLTVLASLAGTPWAARLRGAIAVLEDVGEVAYRVDRSVRQLEDACGLGEAAAVLLGTFTNVTEAQQSWIADFWREWAQGFSRPVVWNVGVGHGPRNCAWPLGSPASLSTSPLSIRMRWPELPTHAALKRSARGES